VVFSRAVRVVMNDGGHMAEDGGVQQGWDDHHAAAERLLVVGGGRHVAEADGGHAGHREVEGSDVHTESVKNGNP